DKCKDILSELLFASPNIVLLQETKLSKIDDAKPRFFLPRNLCSHRIVPASGTSGGLITAWNDALFTYTNFSHNTSTLTVCLSETSSDLSFYVINVYAPTTPDMRLAFLDEFKDVASVGDTPRVACGDFNM
ncbi:hypothetical protein PVAP13_7KG105227, partial [Panicum virgatum]